MGQDQVSPGDNGVFKVTEHDESMTRLQTITKVERVNDTTIKIHGGLGTKLVPPTKMDYVMTFEETSPHQIQFSVEITKREAQMKKYDHLILAYETRPEEQFYGFGEQFSYSTLKGQKIPILVRYG
jgi:hypothetical protein